MSAALMRRQVLSLEHVMADQRQRLGVVQAEIATLAPSDLFDQAAGRTLSTEQVELAVSALDSEMASHLSTCLIPRQVHTRFALCGRYVDMLACADRIRSVATAFGFRQATPFVNTLPNFEEWLLSQRSAGVSEDDLRLQIADYQHRIKLLQRRFKDIPGLYPLL